MRGRRDVGETMELPSARTDTENGAEDAASDLRFALASQARLRVRR